MRRLYGGALTIGALGEPADIDAVDHLLPTLSDQEMATLTRAANWLSGSPVARRELRRR